MVGGGQDSVHGSVEVDDAETIRILHVQDDETIATVAREMFEALAWQVQTCGDGNAALEHMSGEAHYDFMLFDYDLPGISGLKLVHRARKLAHRSRTLVGVLSATSVEAEAREVGADVFLRKPQDLHCSVKLSRD